ncbi:MAG: beta-galactosidase, partial [Eubacteriales bacterium]
MKYPPIFKDVPHMIHGGDYNPDQWLDYPEILSEDIRLMKLAGINSATVAIFAWSALEPREGEFHLDWLEEIVDNLYKNGIYTVLATPSGARPAWLDLAYPEACRTESNGDKRTHGIRQNHCMTSPVFREKVARIDRVLAERFANHPGVKMWHISNEFGGFCYCEKCKQKFRSFLREKYHNNIKELNHEWWTAFWSHTFDDFDQIDPPGPLGENCVHGLNIDWMRFTTWNTCDFLDSEAAVLRQYAPNIPITTNLMGTYRYLNYFEMAKHIDVVSWDAYPQYHAANMSDAETAVDIGFKHDLMRSLLRRPFMLMESTPSCVNWTDINKMKRPGMHRLASLQAVAHGADTVQYFQWRKSRGASEKFHGAVVDHEGSENTRVFREVAELGKDLAKLDEIIGTDTPAEVGIVYDWENEWAIADFQGFKHDRKYYETAKDFYRGFFNHARNVDFVPREGDFSRYKLLVAPM